MALSDDKERQMPFAIRTIDSRADAAVQQACNQLRNENGIDPVRLKQLYMFDYAKRTDGKIGISPEFVREATRIFFTDNENDDGEPLPLIFDEEYTAHDPVIDFNFSLDLGVFGEDRMAIVGEGGGSWETPNDTRHDDISSAMCGTELAFPRTETGMLDIDIDHMPAFDESMIPLEEEEYEGLSSVCPPYHHYSPPLPEIGPTSRPPDCTCDRPLHNPRTQLVSLRKTGDKMCVHPEVMEFIYAYVTMISIAERIIVAQNETAAATIASIIATKKETAAETEDIRIVAPPIASTRGKTPPTSPQSKKGKAGAGKSTQKSQKMKHTVSTVLGAVQPCCDCCFCKSKRYTENMTGDELRATNMSAYIRSMFPKLPPLPPIHTHTPVE